jgi:NDP-sugar pyrophosphorylase family protein
MDQPIEFVMNKTPFCVAPGYDLDELRATMTARCFHQVPVIDEDQRIVDLVVIDDLLKQGAKHDNWVVLMAGGLGKRLLPLTKTMPKPLVKVGGKPVLENILEELVNQGFQHFYISVNYMGDQIKSHFGDGNDWGVEILYLDEDQALGTAGALSLIDEIPDQPMIVMNADLVTEVNFSKMLEFHQQNGAICTMGVREYDFQVQFGVVEIENGVISSINEKPVHRFLVNGGIYVLEPEVIKSISKGTSLDMPMLFDRWITEGKKCSAFPIHEFWLDIGHIDDLHRAEEKFKSIDE